MSIKNLKKHLLNFFLMEETDFSCFLYTEEKIIISLFNLLIEIVYIILIHLSFCLSILPPSLILVIQYGSTFNVPRLKKKILHNRLCVY